MLRITDLRCRGTGCFERSECARYVYREHNVSDRTPTKNGMTQRVCNDYLDLFEIDNRQGGAYDKR